MASSTELFLDDAFIEMSGGVSRRIHAPRKHRRNPVMVPERWWEGDIVLPSATLYDPDEKRFKMWYRTGAEHDKLAARDGHAAYTAYATSADGVNWERPELGLFELTGRGDHSIVLMSEGQDPRDNFTRQGKKAFILSVIPHPRPKDENEKYVCMFFDMKMRGAYLGYSADGLRWRREPEPFWQTPVDAAPWGDDNVKSMIYDRLRERWVMYRRVIPQESERLIAQPGDEDWARPERTMRVMGYADSADLRTWQNHRIILSPDADDPADVEFYGLTCHPYEQVYVGYLWVYHMEPGVRNIDVQLVTSRDGVTFTRCCRREPFIPAGPRDYYDYMVCPGYQAEPLIVDDMVYLYYEACNYAHERPDRNEHCRTTAGLVTFPRDRFAGLESGPPHPCQLVTKPFVVEQPKLLLNAATWLDGYIRAEVMTREWKPVAGFTLDEATAIHGNALAHPVRWRGNDDLGRLAGREVRLKFDMHDARIHALTLEDQDRPLGELPPLRLASGMADAPTDV